jgi:hypothetical protein
LLEFIIDTHLRSREISSTNTMGICTSSTTTLRLLYVVLPVRKLACPMNKMASRRASEYQSMQTTGRRLLNGQTGPLTSVKATSLPLNYSLSTKTSRHDFHAVRLWVLTATSGLSVLSKEPNTALVNHSISQYFRIIICSFSLRSFHTASICHVAKCPRCFPVRRAGSRTRCGGFWQGSALKRTHPIVIDSWDKDRTF